MIGNKLIQKLVFIGNNDLLIIRNTWYYNVQNIYDYEPDSIFKLKFKHC